MPGLSQGPASAPKRPRRRLLRLFEHVLTIGFLWLCVYSFAPAVALLNPPPTVEIAAPTRPSEYIQRFIQYVRWPGDKQIERWHICVPGGLAQTRTDYDGADVRGREFEIRLSKIPDDMAGCHVLDLSGLTLEQAKPFLVELDDAPILTVGSGTDFCSAGGAICLTPSATRPFSIDLNAVRRAQLQINARLLRMGDRSDGAGPPP